MMFILLTIVVLQLGGIIVLLDWILKELKE